METTLPDAAAQRAPMEASDDSQLKVFVLGMPKWAGSKQLDTLLRKAGVEYATAKKIRGKAGAFVKFVSVAARRRAEPLISALRTKEGKMLKTATANPKAPAANPATSVDCEGLPALPRARVQARLASSSVAH